MFLQNNSHPRLVKNICFIHTVQLIFLYSVLCITLTKNAVYSKTVSCIALSCQPRCIRDKRLGYNCNVYVIYLLCYVYECMQAGCFTAEWAVRDKHTKLAIATIILTVFIVQVILRIRTIVTVGKSKLVVYQPMSYRPY